MIEHPITFNTEMVCAILEGRKTQTRQIVKFVSPKAVHKSQVGNFNYHKLDDKIYGLICPYGKPGHLLWVRETWGVGTRPHTFEGCVDGFEYKADMRFLGEGDDLPMYPNVDFDFSKYAGKGWRPSIHMPRAASRILLEIESIKVERLQEISEEDAIKEGIELAGYGFYKNYLVNTLGEFLCPIDSFMTLWQSIHGKESWDKNPWVWVIKFKKA